MNNDLLEKIAETLIEELDILEQVSDEDMEKSIQASIPMIINSSDEYIKKLKDGDDNARRQVGDFIKILKQYADGNEAADDKIINNYKDEITDPDKFKKNLKSIVDAYQELVKTEPDAAKEEKPEDDPNDESTDTFDINDEDKAQLIVICCN